jgi:hypothetical protein
MNGGVGAYSAREQSLFLTQCDAVNAIALFDNALDESAAVRFLLVDGVIRLRVPVKDV